MISPSAIAHGIGRRLFYGWVMLGVAFVGMFVTGPGQTFTVSVFVNPLLEDLGLSRTSLAGIYAWGTGVAGLGLYFVGRLIDRFGPRWMIAALALCLGLACLLFPLVSGLISLFFAFTAIRFFGQGALTLGCNNLVAQWFSRRRGMALSIATGGFALGSAVYPPAVQWLILQVGWRASWMVLGILVLGLMVPLAVILVVNKPEELGLLPDGDGATAPALAAASSEPSPDEAFTVSEALATPTFWILALSLAIPSMLITGLIFHQISYFQGQGLDAQSAANIFTVTAVSMVFFMGVFGQLLDRFQTRAVVGVGILTLAVTMWVMRIADTPLLAGLYGVGLGATSGAIMTTTGFVWPRYFGRKNLSGIQGAAFTVSIIGASLGPIPFAVAYDFLGGYHDAVLGLSLLPLCFGVLVFFTPPARKPGRTRAASG